MTIGNIHIFTPDPEGALIDLRSRLLKTFASGNPVRDEAHRHALSASILRFLRYGVEDGFQYYTGRDVASFSLITHGHLIEDMVRSGFIRGLLEDDQQLLELFRQSKVALPLQHWLDHCRTLSSEGLKEFAEQTVDPEERSVVHWLMVRRFPARAHFAWLESVPKELTLLRYAMARDLARLRADLGNHVANFVRENREVLLCREPDSILAPLVQNSTLTPQALLAPFAGYYGEETLLAAAEWHLEHNQHAQVNELVCRIRPLSIHYDQALLVQALSEVAQNRLSEAAARLSQIEDSDRKDLLLVHLADHSESQVTDAVLTEIAKRACAKKPEILARCLRILLNRRRLDLARRIARMAVQNWNEHPVLSLMLKTLLPNNLEHHN